MRYTPVRLWRASETLALIPTHVLRMVAFSLKRFRWYSLARIPWTFWANSERLWTSRASFFRLQQSACGTKTNDVGASGTTAVKLLPPDPAVLQSGIYSTQGLPGTPREEGYLATLGL